QSFSRGLQGLEPLIVVAFGRDDRGVPEQVADLGEWNATLDQPRRIFVPQVVPVQVDLPEPLLARRGQVLVAALAPARCDPVRLEDRHDPRLLERRQWLTGLIAEHWYVGALAFTGTVETEPLEHGEQPGGADWDDAGAATLGRRTPQRDQSLRPVDVGEAKRQHLPAAHAGVERSDDHRPEMWRGNRQQR